MSSTLFALVILQGTNLTFSPGYTTAAECLQQFESEPGRRAAANLMTKG
jgi:hypothetical protein